MQVLNGRLLIDEEELETDCSLIVTIFTKIAESIGLNSLAFAVSCKPDGVRSDSWLTLDIYLGYPLEDDDDRIETFGKISFTTDTLAPQLVYLPEDGYHFVYIFEVDNCSATKIEDIKDADIIDLTTDQDSVEELLGELFYEFLDYDGKEEN